MGGYTPHTPHHLGILSGTSLDKWTLRRGVRSCVYTLYIHLPKVCPQGLPSMSALNVCPQGLSSSSVLKVCPQGLPSKSALSGG